MWWLAPLVAALPLTGGRAEVQVLGAELRDAGSLTPAQLVDGTPAVAWTDNDPDDRDGRLHLAAEAAATVAERAGAAGSASAHRPAASWAGRRTLVLPVTCSAACDVRVQLGGRVDALGQLALRKAGTGRLEIEPSLGPHRAAACRSRARACALRGAGRAHGERDDRDRPSPPPPRPAEPKVIGARATRDGDDVVVTWRIGPAGQERCVLRRRRGDERAVHAELLAFGTVSDTSDEQAPDPLQRPARGFPGRPLGDDRRGRVRRRPPPDDRAGPRVRLAWAALALALAAPAPAAAAPFGELPFRPVSGAATCLRADRRAGRARALDRRRRRGPDGHAERARAERAACRSAGSGAVP